MAIVCGRSFIFAEIVGSRSQNSTAGSSSPPPPNSEPISAKGEVVA